MRIVSILGAAAVAVVTLSLDTASGGGAIRAKEGGTFRLAVVSGFVDTIDPAVVNHPFEGIALDPACGSLMDRPAKPLPEGGRLKPEIAAADPVVSRDGKTYTFTIRKDARFSNGAPVTARAFQRAIERILDPKMSASGAADLAARIVGAEEVLAGTATGVSGVVARGRTLIVKLKKRDPTFVDSTASFLCAVPAGLPADPEGAKPPLPSPAPYYVAEYVPGERVVLARNRFYKGERPQHVNRIEADLGAVETTVIDGIANGSVDYGLVTVRVWAERSAELARRYGVNKGRFFVRPGNFVRMFVVNTSRPLFRANVKLRQAVNFAVDRSALTRELGSLGGTPTDQFLLPSTPVQERAHLSTRRAGPPQGTRAGERSYARREGGSLHAGHAGGHRYGADPEGQPEGDRTRARNRPVSDGRHHLPEARDRGAPLRHRSHRFRGG